MKNLDRSEAPKIKEISTVSMPKVSQFQLRNGIPVSVLNSGKQDIVKIEFVSHAGRFYEKDPLSAKLTAQLLKYGTGSFTDQEINDKMDFYGASLSTYANMDVLSVSLICLSKHLEFVLPIMLAVLMDPVFSDESFNKVCYRNQQRLILELAKNDVLAYRELTERIFTDKHPYGYNSDPSDYESFSKDKILSHYQKGIGVNNSFLFISGKINDTIQNLVTESFEQMNVMATLKGSDIEIQNHTPEAIEIELANGFQTSLRLGKRMFNRNHKDFASFYLLNTIFGGYFGSRLMKNIREEKGYTYNISSMLDCMISDGYFSISCDLSNDLVDKAYFEIEKEMEILKTKLIPDEELMMVKNYLIGNFLNYVDGPFNTASFLKSIVVNGNELNYLETLISNIKNTDSNDLLSLANKYLNINDFWEVRVGNKNISN